MKKSARSKKKPFRIDAALNANAIRVCYRTAKYFGLKITQKDVAEITGLSVRSVRGYLKNERSQSAI